MHDGHPPAPGPAGPAAEPAGERRSAAARRDRDAAGRARSARPRDALGRPLPYGAPGVAGQPEGVRRCAGQTLAEAQRLLERGMPFHAHEVLEDAWKTAAEPDRALWRGLAQLAVGVTHAARGNVRGAAALLRRGAAAVGPYGGRAPHGVDAAGLASWARLAANAVEQAPQRGAADRGSPAPLPPMPRLRQAGRRDAAGSES